MRISDHIIPAALFTVGLGLVSAFGFEGSGGQNNNGVGPAVGSTAPRDRRPARAVGARSDRSLIRSGAGFRRNMH